MTRTMAKFLWNIIAASYWTLDEGESTQYPHLGECDSRPKAEKHVASLLREMADALDGGKDSGDA